MPQPSPSHTLYSYRLNRCSCRSKYFAENFQRLSALACTGTRRRSGRRQETFRAVAIFRVRVRGSATVGQLKGEECPGEGLRDTGCGTEPSKLLSAPKERNGAK